MTISSMKRQTRMSSYLFPEFEEALVATKAIFGITTATVRLFSKDFLLFNSMRWWKSTHIEKEFSYILIFTNADSN